MFTSSGSSFEFRPRAGCHLIAGSRCHESTMSSVRMSSPLSFRWSLICSNTSFATSDGVQRFAVLPYTIPGVSQSEMSIEKQSTWRPSP